MNLDDVFQDGIELGKIFIKVLGYVLLLVTLPLWILPYKFYKRFRTPHP